MIINKDNIKTILGISGTDYDDQIDYLIPQILDQITQYCRNDFIKKSAGLYVYDDCDVVIDSTTITLDTDLPLIAGDFIRLYGTTYNDDLFQVNSYSGGIITIENTKTMRAETTESIIISLVEFPSEFISLIGQYIKGNVVNDGQVKREKIYDTEIEYGLTQSTNDFVSQNTSFLSSYRKVYKDYLDELFGEPG